MSDELQISPVIDLDALLQPVSDENPSGESLRYSGLYDEISEARRADVNVNQGEWQTELKVADHRKVVSLAIPALTDRSKDLQIAVWLSEALIKLNNFAGLRDSLKLVAGLQENFWETLHPEIDEGDMEGRANAIAWLDTQGATVVRTCAITAGPGFGFTDWQDAKRFDFPENLEMLDSETQAKYNDLKQQAETENRVTSDKWKSAVNQTRRAFCEQTNYTIDECWAAFAELNRVIEEKYDRNQMPGLSGLQKALDDVHQQVKKLLERKRAEEPDENDSYDEGSDEAGTVNGEGEVVSGGPGGPVRSRPEALKRLGEIALFFQRTEPHSPVAYLVQRAVKWGNMPLETWLQDVIKDEAVLFQLRQTLGLDSGGSMGSSADDTWGASEESSPADESASASSDDW